MKNILDILAIFGAKYLLFILIGVAIFYFLKQNKDKQKQIVIFSLMVLPVSYVFAKIASYFYYDVRPFVAGGFVPLIPHLADNGFPSDHTLLGSAVAASIFCFNKKLGFWLFVLALLVGLSRIYAGVHHLADIVGSVVIVIVVAYIASLFKQVSICSKK